MIDPILLIGITGGTIVLLAFFMNQIGKWQNQDLRYDLVNALGSGLLMAYAALIQSWPFLILNLVWFAVSLKDVYLFWHQHHSE